MRINREPALILGLVAAVVQLVSAFVFPLSSGQQGALNAVAVAVLGVVTAVMVKGDKLAPAILGFVQAGVALGVAFGWHLAPENQAVLMTFVSALVAVFVRQIVVAPVPPTDARATAVDGNATDPAI